VFESHLKSRLIHDDHFCHQIELNDPSSALEDLCYEIAPPKVEEDNIIKPREFSRPVAPGRGRGGMRRTPSASSS
jgi:hypothetical protein